MIPAEPSWYDILNLIPPVLTVAILAMHAPAVAAGLLTGAPSLTQEGCYLSSIWRRNGL